MALILSNTGSKGLPKNYYTSSTVAVAQNFANPTPATYTPGTAITTQMYHGYKYLGVFSLKGISSVSSSGVPQYGGVAYKADGTCKAVSTNDDVSGYDLLVISGDNTTGSTVNISITLTA